MQFLGGWEVAGGKGAGVGRGGAGNDVIRINVWPKVRAAASVHLSRLRNPSRSLAASPLAMTTFEAQLKSFEQLESMNP